jgi:hypothetical protein
MRALIRFSFSAISLSARSLGIGARIPPPGSASKVAPSGSRQLASGGSEGIGWDDVESEEDRPLRAAPATPRQRLAAAVALLALLASAALSAWWIATDQADFGAVSEETAPVAGPAAEARR